MQTNHLYHYIIYNSSSCKLPSLHSNVCKMFISIFSKKTKLKTNKELIAAFLILLSSSIINSGCAVILPVTLATAGIVAIEEKSLGNVIDDSLIFTKIKTEFAVYGITSILSKIKISISEGRVLLTGIVQEQRYADEAVKCAWSVSGVKEVINELIIDPIEMNIDTSHQDAWILSQIKAKLLVERKLRSVNYSITVSHGFVYVIGIAKNQEELDTALTIMSSVKSVKKVFNHAILKNDPRRIN